MNRTRNRRSGGHRVAAIALLLVAAVLFQQAIAAEGDNPGVTDVAPDIFSATVARARAGDPVAQFALANLYAGGEQVDQDYQQAGYWYRQAAERGFASAQYNLGVLYDRGLGVVAEPAVAAEWYARAAAQGHPRGQHNLAMLYASGRGLAVDQASARAWFRSAAESGFADSQYNLGVLLAAGEGGDQDLAQARDWLRKAADQGVTEAADLLTRLPAPDQIPVPDQGGEVVESSGRSETVTSAAEDDDGDAGTADPAQRRVGDWWIQLIALRSRADILDYWTRLQRQHPDLLGSLEALTPAINQRASRPLFRLLAGTFVSERGAGEVCTELKSRDRQVQCFPAKSAR